MFDSLAGRLLVATPQLIDPNFHRSVVLVIQHDESGAIGVVLNRPTAETIETHLPEWLDHVSAPGLIHFGGPVEPEVAVCLGSGSRGEPTGVHGLVLVDLGEGPTDVPGRIRIYSGYAGWGHEQLQMEIGTGSWYVVPATANDPFSEAESMWADVLRRQKGFLSLLSTFPDDVRLN